MSPMGLCAPSGLVEILPAWRYSNMKQPLQHAEPVALRPFIPARDFERSKQFYQGLGFSIAFTDGKIALMCSGAAQFLLQDFYQEGLATNLMLQIIVDDVDQWWHERGPKHLAEQFDLAAPKPPAVQPWGLKVGFIHDPSGVLWHIAELPLKSA